MMGALVLAPLRLVPLLAMTLSNLEVQLSPALSAPWLSRSLRRLLAEVPAHCSWDPKVYFIAAA
jgi:hypothetical protein